MRFRNSNNDGFMEKHTYEVEIKSLLGSEDAANQLIRALEQSDPDMRLIGKSAQKNHYFVALENGRLSDSVSKLLSRDDAERLVSVLEVAKGISVRTREADGVVLLVVKASVDDTTSENGTARLEFEAPASATLDELDNAIVAGGFEVQAKWSRERREYELSDKTRVCVDRNAGYGYVAEFEQIVSDAESVESAKSQLRERMAKLGISELPQDRLERMFAHYNANWREYYGTNKTFTIE
jgi:adenylate cyclase class IV